MNKKIYSERRQKLIDSLPNNSLVILFSGTAKHFSADANYPFEVNHNFYYLCGLAEENLMLIIKKIDSEITQKIYINQFDPIMAKWVGKSLSQKEIKQLSGLNDFALNSIFPDDLKHLLDSNLNIYLDHENYMRDHNESAKLIDDLKEKNRQVFDIHPLITKMRLIKSKEEIELIKTAIEITNIGIMKILDILKNELYEFQYAAFYEYEVKFLGARGLAFPTIASSGKNAAVLHYVENSKKTENGEMILFDLGANYNYYNSDISRTFPISGKYSKRQKQLYQIVLRGQKYIIRNVKPGITLRELNNLLIEFYYHELSKIKMVKSKDEVKKYYYHGVSHHLGMDTHDVFILDLPLQAGNIITVEPGLYVEKENIGIRIEDNILVTKTGRINLSKGIIKEIDEIEKYLED